jgi:GNAT superfamily N-acetyltransferase
MEFRKSIKSDINPIMNIIRQAQDYLKEQGIDQWQNNYPNMDTINGDIDNGNSYVLVDNGRILGTVAVIFDGEKTYDTIYNGKWLSHEGYTTIHRLAVDSNYRGGGISSLILKSIEKISLDRKIHSIKVDTHRGNMPMQKFLQNHGFEYCGIIYLEDGNERLAFEKIFWDYS